MSSPLGLHSFKGGVAAGSLSSAVNNSVTTFPINTIVVANWPPIATGPFKIVIDQSLSTEESCLVTAATTTSFTVTRAYDGSTAYAHANGATFYTAPEAEAMQDVAQHVYDTTRNDHTQYMLSASLVSGYGLTAMPTPAVDLTYVDTLMGLNTTTMAGGATTTLNNFTLAVGTYAVDIDMEITATGSGACTFTMLLADGTATATFEAQQNSSYLWGGSIPTSGAQTIHLTETIVVTTGGTILVKSIVSSTNGGTVSLRNYRAIRIA